MKELLGRLAEESVNRSAAANFLYIVLFLFMWFFCIAFFIIIVSYVKERHKHRYKQKITPAEVMVLGVSCCLILMVFAGICVIVATVCMGLQRVI